MLIKERANPAKLRKIAGGRLWWRFFPTKSWRRIPILELGTFATPGASGPRPLARGFASAGQACRCVVGREDRRRQQRRKRRDARLRRGRARKAQRSDAGGAG